MPNDINYHQNNLELRPKQRVFYLAFFRYFVKAGLTLTNIATYSAMGFFPYYHASRRTLSSLSNEYCQVDAK